MFPNLFSSALSLIAICSSLVAAAPQYCKPIPGSPHWPSIQDWDTLNNTVGGRLIAPIPPGSACHPESPNYNNATCSRVYTSWASSDWHARNPFTSDYNDDTCLPSILAPCSKSGYPAYVVNATNAEHVQAAVNFAARTGVRLIVKGTGHDWPARSAGPNSLSIYTHNIRGIDIDTQSAKAKAHGAAAAVKIAAGMRMFEVYKAAKDANLTVVGGADLNVGIGGWILNGGHSPISAHYGLGADQVLEMEVVTADGKHRIINETSNPELFWAMRGGGGSTYGAMLSVTVKAYPALPTTSYFFALNTTAASPTYWNLVANFHSHLPSISEQGGMGYYFIYSNTTLTAPTDPFPGKLYGMFLFPHKTQLQASAIMDPIVSTLKTTTIGPDTIKSTVSTTPSMDFTTSWLANTPQNVGVDGRLGSYLLSNSSLLGNLSSLAHAIEIGTHPTAPTLGHLIAGPGVRNAIPIGGSNAVLPAWRKAYTHTVLVRSWPYLNATVKAAMTTDLRDVGIPALKALEKHSGAYVNEADPTNPDWKHDYWGGGDHYERLLKAKRYWDPSGVFWCKPCVGHDLWEIVGGDGVGQEGLQLCRK